MNKIKLPTFDKEFFRTEVKQRISRLSEEERNQFSEEISNTLLNLPRISETDTVIIYQGLTDEVSLTGFTEAIRQQGKKILTIAPNGEHDTLPIEESTTLLPILIPGRAFTRSGKRIGRGGGWYDRFLQEHPRLYSVGICFGCQIFEDLPQDSWDIPLNTVVYSSVQSGQ